MSRRWWATSTFFYHLATGSPTTAVPATAAGSACELPRTNRMSHLAWLPAPLLSTTSRPRLKHNNNRACPVTKNSRKRARSSLGQVVLNMGSGRRWADRDTRAAGAEGNSVGCTSRSVWRRIRYRLPSMVNPAESVLGCAKVSDGDDNGVLEVEDFLRQALRMSDVQARNVMAQCEGLSVGVASRAMAFLCGGGLDLSVPQMRSLAVKQPRILGITVEDILEPQTDAWLGRAGLGLSRGSLGRMVVDCPEVLSRDYDSELAPIIVWLLGEVGLSRDKTSKLLASSPSVLAADLDAELRPKHRWLTGDLGLDAKGVGRLLSLAPEVLHASMEETLLPAFDWVKNAARCDTLGAGRLVIRAPELLVTDTILLETGIDELASAFFDGDRGQAYAFFPSQPELLLQSDRLLPLVQLLSGELKASMSQAKETIAKDPSLLEFQLEKRVLPRLEAVRKAGIGDVVNAVPLTLDGKLKVLGKFSDARFHKWLRREGGGGSVAAQEGSSLSPSDVTRVAVEAARSW